MPAAPPIAAPLRAAPLPPTTRPRTAAPAAGATIFSVSFSFVARAVCPIVADLMRVVPAPGVSTSLNRIAM